MTRHLIAFVLVGVAIFVGRPCFGQVPKLRAILKVDTGPIVTYDSVAFSPDGTLLATGGSRYCLVGGPVKLWDVKTGKENDTIKGAWGSSVAFSPDGRLLASIREEVTLWGVQSGTKEDTLKGNSIFVMFSPDGTLLASVEIVSPNVGAKTLSAPLLPGANVETNIKLWNVKLGREKATLVGNLGVSSVTFSPDGSLLATGGGTSFAPSQTQSGGPQTIKLWELKTGQEKTSFKAPRGCVSSLKFSPDGKLLAWGNRDNTITLWDLKAGEEKATLKGHTGIVRSVAFSPDGTLLASGSADRTISLWDVKTGQEKGAVKAYAEVEAQQREGVVSVMFSPDGTLLASVGGPSEPVKLWDVK